MRSCRLGSIGFGVSHPWILELIMRITYHAQELIFAVDDVTPKQRRPHAENAHADLEDLADRYGLMVKIDQIDGLKELGRKLYE